MASKTCSDCREAMPLTAFGSDRAQADGLRTYCRKCVKERDRRRYEDQYALLRSRAKYQSNKRNRVMRAVMNEAKDRPCADCHERFPVVCMDFDHRDPTEKVRPVSYVGRFSSLDELKAEIAKCDVVCSNCHRIRTWITRAHVTMESIDRGRLSSGARLIAPAPRLVGEDGRRKATVGARWARAREREELASTPRPPSPPRRQLLSQQAFLPLGQD